MNKDPVIIIDLHTLQTYYHVIIRVPMLVKLRPSMKRLKLNVSYSGYKVYLGTLSLKVNAQVIVNFPVHVNISLSHVARYSGSGLLAC